MIIKGFVSSFVYYHAHDVITKDHRFGEEKKTMVVTVSHYYILVNYKLSDFMSLFRHSVWFAVPSKQFSSTEFGKCNSSIDLLQINLKLSHII